MSAKKDGAVSTAQVKAKATTVPLSERLLVDPALSAGARLLAWYCYTKRPGEVLKVLSVASLVGLGTADAIAVAQELFVSTNVKSRKLAILEEAGVTVSNSRVYISAGAEH